MTHSTQGQKIVGKRILIMATHGFEQSELEKPLVELQELGATVHVAAPRKGPIRGWRDGDWGKNVEAGHALREIRLEDYDALVIPGGVLNPDALRTDPQAVALVRDAVEAGKVVAAICHGVWLLAEADVVKGRQLTSYHSIKTDLINAGAEWVDAAVVSDQGVVTSRKPDDLDDFVAKIADEVMAAPAAQVQQKVVTGLGTLAAGGTVH